MFQFPTACVRLDRIESRLATSRPGGKGPPPPDHHLVTRLAWRDRPPCQTQRMGAHEHGGESSARVVEDCVLEDEQDDPGPEPRDRALLRELRERVEDIARAVGVAKVGSEEGQGGRGKEDLKRLKERLKDAMAAETERMREEIPKPTWMEYIFGICSPDGRVGKNGSRCDNMGWLCGPCSGCA